MSKPTKWHLRPAKTQMPCLISLRCLHEESLGPSLPMQHIGKTLIRLVRCPGLSEFSLGAQSFYWFCHMAAHVMKQS